MAGADTTHVRIGAKKTDGEQGRPRWYHVVMVQPPPPFGGKPGASGTGRRSLLDVDESEMWAPDAAESAADDFASRFEKATADLDGLSLEDLSEPDGGDARPEPKPPTDAAQLETDEERERREAEAAASMAAKVDKAELEPDLAPDASGTGGDAFSPPEDLGGGELQLDFAAAGISRPSAAAPLPAAKPAAPAPPPSASMSGAASTAMVPSPGTSMVGPVSPAPALPEHDSLLGVDRVSAGLIGLAIGLVVGLFPATSMARSMLDDATLDLFTELEQSVDRPLAVRAGELRQPNAIASEIRAAYGPVQNRFYAVWLGVALPFGVVFSLLRRRQ